MHTTRNTTARRRTAAFAFTEVLFAVMVLGLGFIMIAAMFPVTISQTQTTVQETAAAATARGAYYALANCPNKGDLDPSPGSNNLATAKFIPIGPKAAGNVPKVWANMVGNFINSQNPRYAWTALYRRAIGENVAQVMIIVTQNRTAGAYSVAKDVIRPAAAVEAVLEPKAVPISSMNALSGEIVINKQNANDPVTGILGEGAYLVIGDASTGPVTNGRIIQLGPKVKELSNQITFKVQAGSDLLPNENAGSINPPMTAYVVGRPYSDTYAGSTPVKPEDYEGAAQDIGIYTGFISIP